MITLPAFNVRGRVVRLSFSVPRFRFMPRFRCDQFAEGSVYRVWLMFLQATAMVALPNLLLDRFCLFVLDRKSAAYNAPQLLP